MASVFEATSRTPAASATGRTVRVTSSRSVARNSCPGPLPFCHASPPVDARFGRVARSCAARRFRRIGTAPTVGEGPLDIGQVLFTSLDWLLYALFTPFVFVIARRGRSRSRTSRSMRRCTWSSRCSSASRGPAPAPCSGCCCSRSSWAASIAVQIRVLAAHHAAVWRRGVPHGRRNRARDPLVRRGFATVGAARRCAARGAPGAAQSALPVQQSQYDRRARARRREPKCRARRRAAERRAAPHARSTARSRARSRTSSSSCGSILPWSRLASPTACGRSSISIRRRAAAVPTFALQHLVENAVRHGIARRSDAGRIVVTAQAIGTCSS